MRAKQPGLGGGTLMVPVERWSLSAEAPQLEQSGRAWVNREDTHIGCCNAGRDARCPTGTGLRDEVTENLMQLRDGKTARASDETERFVQQMRTTRDATDTGGRSHHQHLVTAAEESS